MAPRKNIPKWTRAELAAAQTLAEMMGISRSSALEQYVPEVRRLEAAEHKMPESEWVEAKLRTDWLLSEMQDRIKRLHSPEDIGKFLSAEIGDGPLHWTDTSEDLALLQYFVSVARSPSPTQA